jgi:hypothetical protein
MLMALTLGETCAAVYSPRIVSPHVADTYSLKSFAQFPSWRDLEGDRRVWEIFQYLTGPRTGLYPLGVPAWEGAEELSEYGAVTDPVKMLNVYPIGHCGTLGPTMAGIMEGMGIGRARTLIIPRWNHVASEVFYGGKWHYLDLDVRAVFRRLDGSLAAIEEAQRDLTLWQQPNSPRFFPLDPIESVYRAYLDSKVEHRYGMASGGHTMDYVLRQGESFTRWWKPQGGRWNHHASYAGKPHPRNVIEREPRGPKSKHPSFTVHTHGNGRFVYKPNLTAKSSDFEDGVYDSQNVRPGEAGLTLKVEGTGYAIFEVRSPYVIAPLVGDLDSTADDREASVVNLDASGASLAISLDNELTWRDLGMARGSLDLTPHVSGTYGYLLKIGLTGKPDQAVMRSVQITTWVQIHPASLPSLRRGKNRMRLATGDDFGLPTRVAEARPNAANAELFLRHLLEPPNNYDPARRTSRIRGSLVAKVPAPPGTKIAWFSAGASFSASVGATQNTRNAMDFAVDSPSDFKNFYRAEVPSDQSHWHYNADREVKLDRPARAVYVRYVGDPAVNNIRIYAHCIEDRARTPQPVMITHVWSENGVQKSGQAQLTQAGDYEIETAADPVDESVHISIGSHLVAK